MSKEASIDIARSILKNIVALAGGEIICRALGLILVISLARYLGPKDYGIYTLALTFYTIFLLITNLGIDTLLTRDISRDRSLVSIYFGSVFPIKLIVSVLSISFVTILLLLLKYNSLVAISILLLCVGIVFSSLNDTLNSIFFAYESMEYPTLVNIARSSLSLGLILILIFLETNVLLIILAQLFSFLFSLIITLILFNSKITKLKKVKFKFWKSKEIIIQSLPFFFISALFILSSRIDIIMISKYVGEAGVGIYNTAVELINIIMIVAVLINKVFFPSISRYFKENYEKMTEISNAGIKILISVSIPIAVGVFILAPRIITFIFGAKYVGSGLILRILALSVLMAPGLGFLSWVFTAMDNIRIIMWTNGIALLLNVTLNLILLQAYGVLGAAISSVLCSVLKLIILYNEKRNKLPTVLFFRFYYKPIFASLIMGLFLYLANHMALPLLVAAGAILYFAVFISLGGLRTNEIRMIKSALNLT